MCSLVHAQLIVLALIKAILPYAPALPDTARSRLHTGIASSASGSAAHASTGRISIASVARLGSASALPLFSAEHVMALYMFLATQLSRRGSVLVADDATVRYVMVSSAAVGAECRWTWKCAVKLLHVSSSPKLAHSWAC
jgi:hypothetical protein